MRKSGRIGARDGGGGRAARMAGREKEKEIEQGIHKRSAALLSPRPSASWSSTV